MLQPLGGVDQAIGEALGDPRAHFVFPSGVAADFWSREALRTKGAPAALPSKRFVSWDQFKATVFAKRERGERAATARLRSVFAADLLSRNASSPFLSALIPSDASSGWEPFLSLVSRALPRLDRLRLAALKAGERAAAAPLVADWLQVRERWAAFLSEHERFEPAWEGRSYEDDGSVWTIFFPELLEDWEEYRDLLPTDGRVRILGLDELCPPGAAGSAPELRVFEGALEEIRWALGMAAEAWDADPSLDAVLLSAAGLDRLRPWIEREASSLGLPVDVRQGAPLSDWPAGRFFSLVSAAASGGWGFAPVRDILLSACLPWKDRERCSKLVRFGISTTVMEGWLEKGLPQDPWEYAFKGRAGEEAQRLASFYKRFKKILGAMVDARSFSAIKASWGEFKREFLDERGFDEEADLIFGRCIAVLNELGEAQSEAGLETLPSAYRVFLDALAAERYVLRGGKGGLRVLDWRVGAGLRPGLHLALNAGQKAASVRTGGLSFLREDLSSALGLKEADASCSFIRAYAASGRRVLFSCARSGVEGAQVPHGAFRALGSAGVDDDAVFRRDREAPMDRELRAWRGAGPFPSSLPSALMRGAAAARETCLAEKGADYAQGDAPSTDALAAVDSRLRERARSLLARHAQVDLREIVAEGPALSVSLLEAWLLCPWKALFESVLRVREDVEGLESFDPAFKGIFLHRALKALYDRIAALGPFSAARLEEYRSFIAPSLDEAVDETVKRSGRFSALVLRSEFPFAAAAMGALLDCDAAVFDGAEVASREESLVLSAAGRPWVLEGKIDRIMRVHGADWVIDYKSGASLTEKDMKLPEDDARTALAEVQLTGYLALLEGMGRGGGAGLYWSAQDRAYHWLCGSPEAALDEAGLAEAKKRFFSLLDGLAEGLASGPFRLASWKDRPKACASCALTGACRVAYGTK